MHSALYKNKKIENRRNEAACFKEFHCVLKHFSFWHVNKSQNCFLLKRQTLFVGHCYGQAFDEVFANTSSFYEAAKVFKYLFISLMYLGFTAQSQNHFWVIFNLEWTQETLSFSVQKCFTWKKQSDKNRATNFHILPSLLIKMKAF